LLLADLHVHSNNSPDADDSVDDLCAAAVAKKLAYIAITDHCDIDVYIKDRYESRIKQSYLDMLNAQDTFDGKVGIIRGVELGNALSDAVLSEKVAESRPYDVVLGSQHHVSNMDDFASIDYDRVDPVPLLHQYFDEVGALIDWGKFDVLTHLTYPFRYINGIYHKGIDIRDFYPQIETVLKKLVASDKALEINTSGLRQPYGQTLPGLGELELYRSLGGKLITIGSDAHCKEDVGANIIDGMRLAKKAGFGEYFIYKQRVPVAARIDAPAQA
jgi:histidinol-phosphatase (PHP family)